MAAFLAKGHVNFSDEVTLGTALSRIVNAPKPAVPEIELFGVDVPRIRRIIDSIPGMDISEPHYVQALLHAPVFHWSMNMFPIKRRKFVYFCPSMWIPGSSQSSRSPVPNRMSVWCSTEH